MLGLHYRFNPAYKTTKYRCYTKITVGVIPFPLCRAGLKRHPGVFSFGFFSLDKQRKETRPPVREPALKQSVAIATQNYCQDHFNLPSPSP
jgi:hypothetical protein